MSAPVLSWPFIANGRGLRPRVRRTQRSRHPEAAAAPRAPRPNFPPPGPQSQSFSRSYGSILPTSLIYIVLLTRGFPPWRPDAVMSTYYGVEPCGHFQGPSGGHQTRKRISCFAGHRAPSPDNPIPGHGNPLTRKDNSCWTSVRRLHTRSVAARPS